MSTVALLKVTQRWLGADGTLVRAVTVLERTEASADVDEASVASSLRTALVDDALTDEPTVRVGSREVSRAPRAADDLAAIDVPAVEAVVTVAVDILRDHVVGATVGVLVGESLERIKTALKLRSAPVERQPFPVDGLFETARRILDVAAPILGVPPRALVPLSVHGNPWRVDVRAYVRDSGELTGEYEMWMTKEGEFGLEAVASQDE